ncbi:MAG: crossover junction endodeoxyribonuclease RuvC [Phycisphaerales bacterium]
MRFLGIDPGTRLTGYGCLVQQRGQTTIAEAGVIRLNEKTPIHHRLCELEDDFRDLLDRTKPDAVAVEMLYSHYAHPTTAIVMGHARGVILLVAQRKGLQLVELRPTEIKKSLTGHGHAKKDQIQRAIQDEFHLATLPKPPDVADALAIALCALRRAKLA